MTPDHMEPMEFQMSSATKAAIWRRVGLGLKQPTTQQILDGWDGWDDPVVDPFPPSRPRGGVPPVGHASALPALPAGAWWLSAVAPVALPEASQASPNARARVEGEFPHRQRESSPPKNTPITTLDDDQTLECVFAVLVGVDGAGATASQIERACGKSTRQIAYALKRGLASGAIEVVGTKQWGKRDLPCYGLSVPADERRTA